MVRSILNRPTRGYGNKDTNFGTVWQCPQKKNKNKNRKAILLSGHHLFGKLFLSLTEAATRRKLHENS